MRINEGVAVAIALVWLLLLPLLVDKLLVRLRMLRPNFQGRPIPVGYGLVILFWSAPILLLLRPCYLSRRNEWVAYLLVIVGMGALGFADDLWGNRQVTGLRGHLRAFFRRGRVTTGFVKAVGGLSLAVFTACYLQGSDPLNGALDGAVIALCANALNLLDLRPGRACAAFLLGAIPVIGAQVCRETGTPLPPLVFVVIPALLVYERDSRACVMLGDTGANLLGGALGLAAILAFPAPAPRYALLVALLLLHFVAERGSLSAIIEKNRLLRKLDRMTGKR